MAATPGNDYYKLRTKKTGVPKKYDAESFALKADEYFKHIDTNPHEKKKTESDGDKTKTTIEYIKRPYTIEGLCNYLDISVQSLLNYECDVNHKDMIEVITRVRGIIYDSKLDGATAGIFNANIVIRDLGLKDTATVTHEQSIKELQPNEIKQLKESLSELYGSTQPLTIDITPEESE